MDKSYSDWRFVQNKSESESDECSLSSRSTSEIKNYESEENRSSLGRKSTTNKQHQYTNDSDNSAEDESDCDIIESSMVLTKSNNILVKSDLDAEITVEEKTNNRILNIDSDSESGNSFTIATTDTQEESVLVIEDSDEEYSSKSVKEDKTDIDNDIEELENSVCLLDIDSFKQEKVNVDKTEVKTENKVIPDVKPEKLKTDIADRIRVQQLLAESKRLEIQISKVQEDVTKYKITLRTANLPALPDKGMRLQVALARHETKLRDLLIQKQNVEDKIKSMPEDLVNSIVISRSIVKFNEEQPNVNAVPQMPSWINLPSTSTNIAGLGRKALETHHTQQSLTLDALTRLHNSLKTCPAEDKQAEDPPGLRVTLMPHQKHALAWLQWREKEKPSGGILADDMGLGKTLTMIALILKSTQTSESEKKDTESNSDSDPDESKDSNWLTASSNKCNRGNTLIVCPASLIGQWENEIKNKVRPDLLKVEIYHGTNRTKKESRLCSRAIVVTTYTIVAHESSKSDKKSGKSCNGPLFNIRWNRIILDEGHQIRNHKTKTATAVCELRGKFRWVLTGTPINNKELDLFSLLKFIRCSPFNDLTVWKRWVDNRDAAGGQRLSTLVKALMLRRTKEDLKSKGFLTSLLNKSVQVVEVTLNKDENDLYQKLLEFSKTLLAQFIEQKAEKENYYGHIPVSSSKTKRYHYETEDNPFADYPNLEKLYKRMKNMADVKSTDILVLLLRLRQICCHPFLMKSMLNKDEALNVGIEDNDGMDIGIIEQMKNISIMEGNDNDDSDSIASTASALHPENPIFSPNTQSSKIKAILNTLEAFVLPTNDKAVVVSQWTSMLELLEKVLKKKHVKCVSLTGSVPVKLRGDIVENFNKNESGPKIILLSLTAGGVGLNLVGANHLLLVDVHWNPQLEAQASDRIYRVGQKKQVEIYKFICMETIEETIQKLQQKKLAIADTVLSGSNMTQASKLSLDDLKMLFNLK